MCPLQLQEKLTNKSEFKKCCEKEKMKLKILELKPKICKNYAWNAKTYPSKTWNDIVLKCGRENGDAVWLAWFLVSRERLMAAKILQPKGALI